MHTSLNVASNARVPVINAHPSLHFKKIKTFRSVRVGIKYRALGVEKDSNIVWFWIGSHADYDKLIK